MCSVLLVITLSSILRFQIFFSSIFRQLKQARKTSENQLYTYLHLSDIVTLQ